MESMNPRKNTEMRKSLWPDFLAYLEQNGVCLECRAIRPEGATACPQCGTVVFFKGAKRCMLKFDNVIFPDEEYQSCPTCSCPNQTARSSLTGSPRLSGAAVNGATGVA